jgi:hypothetical protein
MPHPEKALVAAKRLLRSGGHIVASIPNMRYFPVMWNLIRHRSWEYADSGVLDRTHLRFFTDCSIKAMFERAGYKVEKLEGINAFLWGSTRRFRILNALTLGRISDMRYQQFAVVAKPVLRDD